MSDDTSPQAVSARVPATDQLSAQAIQMSIFETSDPNVGKLKAALDDVNINQMTPIECMIKLQELKGMLEE